MIAIHESGSIARAAERLFVTQSAVSQQAMQLEAEFGTPIFDRSARSITLTPIGKELIPKAHALLSSYDDLFSSAKQAVAQTDISIGVVPSVLDVLFPLFLKRFKSYAPDVRITVKNELSANLYTLINEGCLDVAIIAEPPIVSDGLLWQPLVSERLAVACSPAIEDNDPVSVLTKNPFISMPRTSWIAKEIDIALRSLSIDISTSIECDSLASIKVMVEHELGVSLMPKPFYCDRVGNKIQFIELGVPTKERILGVVMRRDAKKMNDFDYLYLLLRETLADAHLCGVKPISF